MIYSVQRNFVRDSTLKQINQELLHSPRWAFRTNFWRYYLVPELQPYNEQDSTTWYGRQNIVDRLQQPWHNIFERVIQKAGSKFVIQRYALTGQTQGQYQTLHYDTSQELQGDFRSYLIYLNDKWDTALGGGTDFELEQCHNHVEFPEPGKLIEFNSQTLHCGNPPSVPNVLRITLVIHGQLI